MYAYISTLFSTTTPPSLRRITRRIPRPQPPPTPQEAPSLWNSAWSVSRNQRPSPRRKRGEELHCRQTHVHTSQVPPRVWQAARQCFCLLFFVTPEGFTTVVANEGLEKERAYFKPGPLGPMALHPLRRMQCKLQVETPSD